MSTKWEKAYLSFSFLLQRKTARLSTQINRDDHSGPHRKSNRTVNRIGRLRIEVDDRIVFLERIEKNYAQKQIFVGRFMQEGFLSCETNYKFLLHESCLFEHSSFTDTKKI